MDAESRDKEIILRVSRANPGANVEEVVSQVSKLTNARPYRVARILHTLRMEERLALEDSAPPVGLREYLHSQYALWFWATFAIVVLTLASIFVLPQAVPLIYLRNVVGTLFVLYLPGYSVVEALYPRRSDLDGLERLALSVGLSLALVPLMGLGLNYTPWGIRLNPLLVSLTLLSLGLSVVAAYRKVAFMTHSSVANGSCSPQNETLNQ